MQVRPPSIYIAQAIRITDGNEKATVGVSGAEVPTSFLQSLMLNATDTEEDLNCQDASSDLFCYLIDTSGYVLAANQEDINVGDFLGVADPQLMRHFLDGHLFRSRVEYNYQALCPTEINCKTDAAPVQLSTLGQTLGTLLGQLANSLFFLMAYVWTTAGGVSEYAKQVTEGLHRCTTKTEHWEWIPGADPVQHDRIDVTCHGVHCVREFYAKRLEHLNAIFIVADPRWCQFCKPSLLFDGPLEVVSNEECLLPTRYRRRPENCFATHQDEMFECRGAASTQQQPQQLILPLLLTVHSAIAMFA